MSGIKQVGKTQKNFDLDLEFGEEGERLVKEALDGCKLEVKRDRWAIDTKNIAVEYESWGKKSGIATTEADYWVFIIAGLDTMIIIETERLKRLTKRYWNNIKKGGDDKASKFILIPIKEVFKKKYD